MANPLCADEWTALLDDQENVVSRRQCHEHGITRDAIRRHLRESTWAKLFETTYVARTGSVSHSARLIAARLEIGGLVVASHLSALWLADRRRAVPEVAHVAVLDGRRVRPRVGIHVHSLPDLGEERVLWSASVPRVRGAHALLDVLREESDDDRRARLVTDVVCSGVATVSELRTTLASRPRIRGRRLLEEMLSEVAAGAQSPLELRDLRNDRRHGLSGSHRQVGVARDGRTDRVDVIYDGNGLVRPVIKELDGRLGHADSYGKWRDMRRDNAAEERNQSHLRYGWRDLIGRPCEVARQTYAVLALHGWRGKLMPCGPTCQAVTP